MKLFTKGAFGLLFALMMANIQISAQTLSLTAPASGAVWCSGTTQNITWTSSGVTSIKIEAAADGVNFLPIAPSVDASSGSYSYTIPGGLPSGNQYRVRISDVGDPSVTSTSEAFTVAVATAITTPPQTQVVCFGSGATLNVAANGANLTYQWYKDGTAINGATNSTFNLTGAPNEAGSYHVVVTGACGTAQTSATAAITVSRLPVITTQPTSQTVTAGGNVTLSVVASDAVSYQWRKNGLDLGVNSANLTLNNVQTSDAGNYDVRVVNSCGNVTSQVATLTVNSGGIGAVLNVDPTLDFGTIQPDGSSQKTLTVRNTGDMTLTVSNVMISGADAQNFMIVGGNAPFNVAPNSSHDIAINFFGNLVRDNYTATVSFTSNANFPLTVELKGKIATAGAAVLTVASALDFGTIMPNANAEKTLTVSNTGSAPLNVSAINITGTNAQNFTITAGNVPFTVAAGATHTVTLKFTGATVGNYTAVATFVSNAAVNPSVALSGVISATGGSKLTIASALDFGKTLLNQKSTKTVTITNTGTAAVAVSAITIEGTNASLFKLATPFTPMTIAAGQTKDIAVEFLPLAEMTANATLRVVAADGTLTTQLSGIGVVSLSVETLTSFVQDMKVAPNPAVDKAIISLNFEKSMAVEIYVADVNGKIIRTLQNMQMIGAGPQMITWDRMTDAGTPASNGMYRVIFRSMNGIVSMPIVLAD